MRSSRVTDRGRLPSAGSIAYSKAKRPGYFDARRPIIHAQGWRVLRLSSTTQLSRREISRSVRASRTIVGEYQLCFAAGLSRPLPEQADSVVSFSIKASHWCSGRRTRRPSLPASMTAASASSTTPDAFHQETMADQARQRSDLFYRYSRPMLSALLTERKTPRSFFSLGLVCLQSRMTAPTADS
jgi:hypothetical protein